MTHGRDDGLGFDPDLGFDATLGSILTPGWCDRLEETFHGPERACIFGRMTEKAVEAVQGPQKDFRFIFGCCTIGGDPRIMRGYNGDA